MSETTTPRRKYEHPNPGRLDVDGVEWWACDPYPTWYRWEGTELLTNHAKWAEDQTDLSRCFWCGKKGTLTDLSAGNRCVMQDDCHAARQELFERYEFLEGLKADE